jgi:caffeoyl-CoA O-methyltransferase
MLHDIPPSITDRMKYLEEIDARDRIDGTPHLQRLRQIPPETGKFLAIMAAAAPDGKLIEIGTSAGYSTLWLALACRETGRKITTFELLEEKAAIARETFRLAAVEDVVEFITGDALRHIDNYHDISFCFLDAEKVDYGRYYEIFIPKLVSGGLLIADNVISHADQLADVMRKAQNDERIDALVVPIGKGELVCRKR